jgi:hypothetical protein
MTERTLDWRPNWDSRSDKHRLSATPMCATLSARASVMRTKKIFLDQGREGACTGFGEEHVMALTPYSKTTSDSLAQQVYYEARRQDEWEGEDYEGSSVNGAMKASRLMARISAWKWAKTTAEAAHGLSYHGAGELGTWWFEGMWDADDVGFIYPTGAQVGGHAYALAGYKVLGTGERAYRIENSWGPEWGDNGGAWMHESTLATLLADEGELAFPAKIR